MISGESDEARRADADGDVSSQRRRVLLVEDDSSLAEQVVDTLRRAKFEVTWVQTGTAALAAPVDDYALIILDLMLPGAHGLDVVKHVRGLSDVPILVLSGRNETADKVRALKLGADDFVTKPFWPDELKERVHARMRRPALMRDGAIEIGPLLIDVAARSVQVRGRLIALTKVEFDLLAALAMRAGDAVSRAMLADATLGSEREGDDRGLDVHMSRLRKKLGPAGRRISTVWGVGYRLEVGTLP